MNRSDVRGTQVAVFHCGTQRFADRQRSFEYLRASSNWFNPTSPRKTEQCSRLCHSVSRSSAQRLRLIELPVRDVVLTPEIVHFTQICLQFAVKLRVVDHSLYSDGLSEIAARLIWLSTNQLNNSDRSEGPGLQPLGSRFFGD